MYLDKCVSVIIIITSEFASYYSMVNQMNSPSTSFQHLGISTVYVGYLLSFIANFVMFYFMNHPFVYLLIHATVQILFRVVIYFY